MKKIIDFWAPWCVPCKTLKPIITKVAETIPVQFVNVDEEPELATMYNVTGLPTVILDENGVQEYLTGNGKTVVDAILKFSSDVRTS